MDPEGGGVTAYHHVAATLAVLVIALLSSVFGALLTVGALVLGGFLTGKEGPLVTVGAWVLLGGLVVGIPMMSGNVMVLAAYMFGFMGGFAFPDETPDPDERYQRGAIRALVAVAAILLLLTLMQRGA